MKTNRANKGQFSIIAALLVSVILVSAVISTYSMVRNAPIQESPKVLTAIGEMNTNIKRILDFTVGYYGSILKVTGNSTYAKGLAYSYLSSGLVNIAHSHPEWNPSFDLHFGSASSSWYMPHSFSAGNISVTYSLAALGIEGIKYETSSALTVTMLESDPGIAKVRVFRDNTEPELGLSISNFWFYNYTEDGTWELIHPETNPTISSSGVYSVAVPSHVNPNSYLIQVEDKRGLMVSAFYSQRSVSSGVPQFGYTFDWGEPDIVDIYETLSTDVMAIELLQNGTLRWLGQSITTQTNPIPPVSVKALHVNTTIGGVTQEVPFQVEAWASDYNVPLGMAGNNSLFNNNNMVVFLVDNNVQEVTIWWDGRDTAVQSSYAWENVYFDDNPSSGTLDNGFMELDVHNFYILSNVIGESETYRADFLRINNRIPSYGSDRPAYVIYNGVVRDILQQEPEYSGGVSACPDFYAQIYLTLPANAPYYTYTARTIFVDSTQYRSISDLSAIQLSNLVGNPLTEDGTSGSFPQTSSSTGLFYDGSPTGWDHHWSQISSGGSGAGLMFTDVNNQNLYHFDSIATDHTGALNVADSRIEINPVERYDVDFIYPLDLTWYGAVVTFDGEPIYTSPLNGHVGLWVMVEHPPIVTLDEYDSAYQSGYDSVDYISNIDSNPDKGAHSSFYAQKNLPDSVYDVLTEENTDSSSNSTLLNDGFEGSIWDTNWNNIPSDWTEDNNPTHSGSASAQATGSSDGYFTSDNLDASGANAIYVDFWFRKDDTESYDLTLYYFDGSSYDLIDELDDNGSDDTWIHYTAKITDNQYFVSDFKIRFDATLGSGERAWIDDVIITKEIQGSDNYQLDLEVQWTNVNYNEENEELCIYMGSTSGENLRVDTWAGSEWETIISSLDVGWNNATVLSHLTSSTFTIRFVGETETGDITQDYWAIDSTLLYCWT